MDPLRETRVLNPTETRRIPRPCLDCGVPTGASRCESCRLRIDQEYNARRDPARKAHYDGAYRRQAAKVRAEAQACWLCGQGAKPDDPWQADHVVPGSTDSPLLPAHRSCNIARANKARAKSK